MRAAWATSARLRCNDRGRGRWRSLPGLKSRFGAVIVKAVYQDRAALWQPGVNRLPHNLLDDHPGRQVAEQGHFQIGPWFAHE